jgi:predicted small metal-binding protein
MTITIPCRRCGELIAADDEEALVERVHEHIRSVHNSPHAPAREHLVAHATRSQTPGDPPTADDEPLIDGG